VYHRSALRTHRSRNEAAPIDEHLVATVRYADFDGWLTGAARGRERKPLIGCQRGDEAHQRWDFADGLQGGDRVIVAGIVGVVDDASHIAEVDIPTLY
jgi:hypothetical protein